MQVALQPSSGAAEPPSVMHRPGQHLLKHAVTAAVRERAAAQLGGTSEAAAAAVCALRQPKLRQVFESVFDCSTASGNNQWMRGKLLQALGYDSRWRPEGYEPPATGSSARRLSDRPRRPPTGLDSDEYEASGDSEQSRARAPLVAGRKKASGGALGRSDSYKRMRLERAPGASASPFAAAAAAAGAPMVIVVVPDGSCPTSSSAAAALAAAAGGAFMRADSLEAMGSHHSMQQPLMLAHQSSGGSTMEAAARAALATLGWGAAGPTTSAASSPGCMMQSRPPASPPCGLAAPAGHSHGYYHPQQQLMQQQQQAAVGVHGFSRMAGSSHQPTHAPLPPLPPVQPMPPMQPMQPAHEFQGQLQPSFQAWTLQQPQQLGPAAGGAAAHLQRHCSAPEELAQGAFNFTFGGPGAMFAPPAASQQCAPPAISLARTCTAPSQLPPAPMQQPAVAANGQHAASGEAALHSPFAAVPGPLPGYDAASATATAPVSPRAASLPAGTVERRVSAQLPGTASESPFAAVASLPLPPRAASPTRQPAHAASPSPPPPALDAQAPVCDGSLLSLGAGDWPSLFADVEVAAPGDSADLQKLYAMWQDGRMSMGF
ncbi:hypothetical protein C2E21_2645 [Chlorella sorokiniana]|uniref:Uncharacterized protein n=1 Tax=Chlorella sorokiniana TaxID=3076 RepID=A0A2P6TYZ2_CHLSO|nr:hypothetical protein C2E21_2645 [Chlorella sorokiniana]|eukprot:PRW59279.1 hypothetical protein C2E21_2645 [Chlorella sorokiniana]